MKNLKLLSVLGIAMLSLLSFTYLKDIRFIKDGTYKASISKVSNKDERGLTGGNGYSDVVTVKIENNIIQYINTLKYNKNSDKLLNLPLSIDNNGNATAEATDFEQDTFNKNDKGWHYTYKLKIKKEELTK